MERSTEDNVFSDEKVADLTYVKSSTNNERKSKKTHPPYLNMVEEAVQELAGRKGVSKARICQYLKTNHVDEVSNLHVKKALKTGMEKKMFENITGE